MKKPFSPPRRGRAVRSADRDRQAAHVRWQRDHVGGRRERHAARALHSTPYAGARGRLQASARCCRASSTFSGRTGARSRVSATGSMTCVTTICLRKIPPRRCASRERSTARARLSRRVVVDTAEPHLRCYFAKRRCSASMAASMSMDSVSTPASGSPRSSIRLRAVLML